MNEQTILIVDDENSIRELLALYFRKEGFHVEEAADGAQALLGLEKFKPDLVLLDIMMPKVDGFDTLDILRNTPQIGATKVIVLTALSQEGDRQRAKDLGADDYLVKSQVVITDVISRVKFHLGLETQPTPPATPAQ